MDETQNPLIGTKIGSFKVLKRLGEGAYGTVFQGVHPTIGRMVAIKVLNKAFSADSQIVERFIDEARAANSINHPNIVQIFDFGQLDDGRYFCIMEYIHGKELNEIIEAKNGLELKYIEIILPQLVSALSAAHDSRVIHRDLKPDNIMVFRTREGIKVKILDFGIAKLLEKNDDSKEHKTKSGDIMGTPAYMAPEQARGQTDKINERTDIYSLGVILYQMLSGKLPIDGRSIPDILIKLINEPPVPLSTVASDLPQTLSDFLDKTLSKNQEDRPATVEDFLVQYESVLYDDPMYAQTAIDDSPSEITEVPYYNEEENGYDEHIAAEYRKSEGHGNIEDYNLLYSSQIRKDRERYSALSKISLEEKLQKEKESYSSYEKMLHGIEVKEDSESLNDGNDLRDSAIMIREELGFDIGGNTSSEEPPVSQDGEDSIIAFALRKKAEQEKLEEEERKKKEKQTEIEEKTQKKANFIFGTILILLAFVGLYYFIIYRGKTSDSPDSPKTKPIKSMMASTVMKSMSSDSTPTLKYQEPDAGIQVKKDMSISMSVTKVMKSAIVKGPCNTSYCAVKNYSDICCCKNHPFETISQAFINTKMAGISGKIKSCKTKYNYAGAISVFVILRCNGRPLGISFNTKKLSSKLKSCVKSQIRSVHFLKFRKLSKGFSYTFK